MIRAVTTAPRKGPRRCYWHNFFVIWPRTVQIPSRTALFGNERVRVCFQPMMRRWSETYKRWEWAMPGQRVWGARP